MRSLSIILIACVLVSSGCTSMNMVRQQMGRDGKPVMGHDGKPAGISVSYTGVSADSAVRLIDASTRMDDSRRAGDVARKSVEQGMPTTFDSNRGAVHTQSGWVFGPGGMGYGTAAYHGWMSPEVLWSERATFGQMYYGPPLPTLVPYGSSAVHPGAIREIPPVPCPKGRHPVTDSERLACTQQDLHALERRVYRRRR